ncbi:tetratricopeptide repeat protein, partial [Paraburkholderia fungorum]|uniref:tetratricopeptide repeat protein n=1 Tax=Paraburkholderia fungorum TaxID=134537 RepID=UPI0038BDD32F
MPHPDSPQQSLAAEQSPPNYIAHEQSPSHQQMKAAVDAFAAGRYTEAMELAQFLTARFPFHPFGWKLLGSIYAQTGRHAEALVPLRMAGQLLPPDAEVHKNLGIILNDLGQFHAALLSCRRALEIDPDSADVHANLGSIFISLGQLGDAAANCRRALEIDPDLAEAHNNLGDIFNALGQCDDAILSFRHALEIRADFHSAAWNLGIALLSEGRYSEGWACYERRISPGDKNSFIAPDLPFPRWSGESLEGKSLMLFPEQGAGDYIQFVRYASLLKERGVARLTVRCPVPLKDLLSTAAGVDEVITNAEPVPRHDYWSFPLSLP